MYRQFIFRIFNLKCVLAVCFFFNAAIPVKAQDFNLNSAVYNTLVGGITGGLGALINKKKEQNRFKVLLRGFVTGCAGGAGMYAGKKLNFAVSQKQNLGYAWLARAVFSAGNSVVENAAANRNPWSVWHFDLAFVRLEFHTKPFIFQPRLMPSNLGGFLFMAIHGRLDPENTLKSGTIIFRTRKIAYSPTLIGSTASNGFLLNDTLRSSGNLFYDIFAHEMIHTFQFQEFSGFNYFFKPLADVWKQKLPVLKKITRFTYLDLNYEMMLINYFLVNRGIQYGHYCDNFLENEAEFLSTGRPACN